jgi:hypothetical protein
MPRVCDVNTTVPAQPYNITQPFRPDRPAMTLARWTGRCKHVRCAGNVRPAAYYSAPFGQDGIIGIYSTGFADCQCLCLLAGQISRHHGDYYSGALAHLDAGGINGLDRPAFIAGTQYTAGDIAQGSAVNNWFFHVILAGNTYSMTEYMQERTVDALQLSSTKGLTG